MAFNVILSANFSKRSNSTKQPTGGTTFSGVLKEPCSILEPTILIESSSATFPSFNYAHIPAFQRYYYITDIVSINGLWEVHMRSDPLATYKTQIGSIIAYVERASSDFDGDIPDTLYPAKCNPTITTIDMPCTYYGVAPTGGTYVLGIMNRNGSGQAGGAVTYYSMTPAQLNSLMAYMLSDQFLDDAGFPSTMGAFQQITQDLARCVVKPIDYITTCMWFPFDIGGAPTSVTIGYWDFGENTFSAKKLTSFAYQEGFTGTIPEHPQASVRGSYLNKAPYTTACIYVQPFGSFPIDLSFAGASRVVSGTIYVDVITGKAVVRIFMDGNQIAEASGMFGIPIQIAQITPDLLGGVSDIGGALLSAYMQNTPGFLRSVGNAINDYMPSPRTSGLNGSFLQNIMQPKLVVRQSNMVDENNTELGRPLCSNRTISTLSGYIKCGEATDSLPGFETERAEIQRTLLNGFFWE